MSESATSLRPLSGAEEFDLRMRSIHQASAASTTDALAELARLVGHQDPFSPAGQARGAQGVGPQGHGTEGPPTAFDPARVDRAAFSPVSRSANYDMGEEPGAPTEPAMVQPTVSGNGSWESVVPRYPSISVRDARPVETSPDAWAAGVTRDAKPDAPALTATREDVPAGASGPKRTMVVLAAVLVLTGGGLAASFLAKPSSTTALSGSTAATPTILAATGPSKVQPVTPAGTDAPSEPSTLLDKNNNDGTTAAKVVNTVEQPVDLSQAVKASTPDADNAAPSPFPQPRKVKTVLVRPDGSIIPDTAAASVSLPTDAAMPSPASQQASLAFDPKTSLPVRQPEPPAAAAQPNVPASDVAMPGDAPPPPSGKSTTRATSKPAASTTQQGSAATQNRTPVATPKAKPAAKPKAVAAASEPDLMPNVVPAAADAAPTASAGAGGGFAVQLGAAPGEAEAKATAHRLATKYAGDLGGGTPAVVKAQAGAKTVYRIRVGSLSQEGAKAICAKVQSAGGGCFVARN